MLKVSELNVAYGLAKVLHDVSIEFQAGQMVFIMGRNGAGKTTFLKTIMGLLKPLSGTIFYEGVDITKALPEELYRKGFRYVAQDKRVFSDLTVRENIEIAAYGCREPLGVALETATAVYPRLKDFLNVKAGQLSGGQRQILLIGQALVGHPKLLLIDEPTQGLASVVIGEIVRILSKLRGNVTGIIVEQNIALMQELADAVCVMKEGKVFRQINEKSQITSLLSLDEV
ncbi:MAG: ATP-binding cassette domain-containing protein [Candidatus Atribacteria bacterium]